MRINNIQITNFRASKPQIQIVQSFADRPAEIQEFYKNIEQFCNKEIKKENYIKNLTSNVNNIYEKGINTNLTMTEKAFIGSLYSSLDSGNIKNITINFLETKIKDLLKNTIK